MTFEESKVVNEVLEDLAENTQHNYKTTLEQFLRFVNSKEESSKAFSIEDLIEEAKTDLEKTQDRISNFYRWLQNESVQGYPLRGKKMKSSSAHQKAFSYLTGFFVNLDIVFKKKWRRKIPRPERKQSLKKDGVVTFYDVDKKTRTIRFNREKFQQFLANLMLRDVAITLALLSSSQDTSELFRLNIGDVRAQGDSNRIFWEGYRRKTRIPFRTFFSKEATRFIRKYIEQERRGAKDSDPLFVYTTRRKGQQRPTEEKMSNIYLASIYRDAARKMGIKWENGERNPLRPKRMRHLFRTACDTTGIPELYINAFMGHANHQGQDYSELSKAKLELEYLRVEPFLTVYGNVEESLEIKEDVTRLQKRIVDLNREIAILSDRFEQQVKEIERKFNQRLDDFFADYQAQMSDDVPEDLPKPSKEDVEKAKKALK